MVCYSLNAWYSKHKCTICDVSSVYRKPVLGRTSLKVCVPFCFRCDVCRICTHSVIQTQARPHVLQCSHVAIPWVRWTGKQIMGVPQLLISVQKQEKLSKDCKPITGAHLYLDTLPSRISLVFHTQTQQESGYVRLGFPRPPLHVYNTTVWTPDHSGPGREEEKGLGFRLSCLVK